MMLRGTRIHLKFLRRLNEAAPMVLGLSIEGGMFRLRLSDVEHHVGVFGLSGYGKTTTVMRILDEGFRKLGLRYVVIDWHGEYRDIVERHGGHHVTLGSEHNINPLQMHPLDDPYEYSFFLAEMFAQALDLTQPQSYLLRYALTELLLSSENLTMSKVVGWLKDRWRPSGTSRFENEIRWALLRRLEHLSKGVAGKILNRPSTVSLRNLPIALSFEHIFEDEVRRILTFTILRIVYVMALSRMFEDRVVIVLEEAGNVIPRRRMWETARLGERLVSELRKYNVSFVIVAQLPSQISREVARSLSTIILHRQMNIDELKEIFGHLTMPQEYLEILPRLETGYALVFTHSKGRWSHVRVRKVGLRRVVKEPQVVLEF